MKTRQLVITALITALVCAITMFPSVRVLGTEGYIHLGDAVIFAAVYLVGWLAIPAAAIGSALADLLGGYVHYAPVTFVIKGGMALICFVLCGKRKNTGFFVLGSVLGECLMVAGYFLYAIVLYEFPSAVASIPFNLIQAASGIALGTVLYLALKRGKVREKLMIDPPADRPPPTDN